MCRVLCHAIVWTAAVVALAAAAVCPAGEPPAPAAVSRPGNPNLAKLKLPPNPRVLVVPFNDEECTRYGFIDPWEAGFVSRRLRTVKQEKYDLVVLEIDTGGGFIASCERIDKEIAECGVPVVAFVRNKAFSGGALVSLACQGLVMTPGSQIGGAQAVGLFGRLDEDQRMKARSFLVAMVEGLSEKNGYPKALARGMVDAECEVSETDNPAARFVTQEDLDNWARDPSRGPAPQAKEVWKAPGDILSLTAERALSAGLAGAVCPDRDALFTTLGVAPATVTVAHITATERVARFLGHPLWMTLLAILALVGLVFELKSPGHGVGFLACALCMMAFFWAAFFADSAGTLELLLFAVGAVLFGVEIFAFPTFGLLGFAGLGLMLASILLSFIPEGSLSNSWGRGSNSPFQPELVYKGLFFGSLVLVALIAVVVGVLLGGLHLPGFKRIALQGEVNPLRAAPQEAPPPGPAPAPAAAAAPQTPLAQLVGKEGVAETILRPTGKVRLEGVSYEAQTEGAWIDEGARVRVLSTSALGLLVRQV